MYKLPNFGGLNGLKSISDKRKKYLIGMAEVVLAVLAVYAVLWAFTKLSPFSQSTYNSYVLQAQRWLQGHLDLGRNYSYLEIAEYNGKYFISFPPIPSVILLPFCMIFDKVPDNLIVTIIGIIGAVYAYMAVYYTTENNKTAVFFALFATVGGNFLHVAVNASVWYFAQVASFTFTMMALYYALIDKVKCGWAPLFLLSLAFGCRPMQIVYLPLVVYLLYKKLKNNDISILDAIKRYWWWVILPLVVGAFYMILNYARFDNIFEFGHNYLPEFKVGVGDGEPQFSTQYLKTNFKRMFALPEIKDGIVQFPRFNGCAFWLISPIFLAYICCFIYGIKKNYKSIDAWMVLVLMFVHMFMLCMHRTLGGSQFGNRYTVDMIPSVLLGIAIVLKNQKSDMRTIFTPMFFWGLGINLVGTVGYTLGWFV